MAAVVLACVFGIDVVVLAPSKDKAKIIMRYFIEHIGDHPIFSSCLEKKTKLERLRQEESKTRIKLNNGGGIFVLSTDEKNTQKSIESAMGESGTVTILDEAGLVSDRNEATVFRMIAGKDPKQSCYVKIGNPFYAAEPYSHFYKSWQDPRYARIFVDYHLAQQEGRLTTEFIEEAKSKPLFSVLFGCEFPDLNEMDPEGYRSLVLQKDIKYGMTPETLLAIIKKEKEEGKTKEPPKLGFDCGAGGDWTTGTLRYGHLATLIGKWKTKDTMQIPTIITEQAQHYGVLPEDTMIDDIGIGRGASDRLKEQGFSVTSVNVGESAIDKDNFANCRAELAWKLKQWIESPNSRVDERAEWVELTQLRYKTLSDRKIQLEPKDKLRRRTGASPDSADSLLITFYERPYIGFV